MDETLIEIQGLMKADRLVNTCINKLVVQVTMFHNISFNEQPHIGDTAVFFEGLVNYCDEMNKQLFKAHELIDKSIADLQRKIEELESDKDGLHMLLDEKKQELAKLQTVDAD